VEQRLDWDERDRIAGVSTGSGRIRYEYDDQDRLVRALTFAGSEERPDTELAFRYDEAGRLVEETQNGVPVAYSHDDAGRLTGRVSPSGTTRLAYDPRGLLAGYASNGHGLSFTRNAAGQETVRTSGPNAFTLRQSYDGRGRLALQLAGRSRTEVGYLPEAHRQAPALEVQGELRRGYDWDRSGRLVGVSDQARGSSRYAYDARDQVQSVERLSNHTSERYEYNALMDLLNSDGMRHGYQDGEVQSVGNTSYRRDARGRVIQKTIQRPGFRPQSWGFQWDDFDHLVATETPEGGRWRYRYDAFGRRVEKRCLTPVPEGRLQGVAYLWQGATLAEEIQDRAGGSRTFRWHFEPGSFRPIAKEVLGEDANSTFYPIVTDHLGTPKEVFDLQGTCQWQGEHSLWGKSTTLMLKVAAVEFHVAKDPVMTLGITLDTLFFDTTNFFTYIDSTNDRAQLPRRGHSKQHRTDLRQVGLGLLVSREGQLPLLSMVYPGNENDVTSFPKALNLLRERLLALGLPLKQLTIVFDRGNNSHDNFRLVDQGPNGYVAAPSPASVADLRDLPSSDYRMLPEGTMAGLPVYRTRRGVWGAERTVLLFVSEELREAQKRGLNQQLRETWIREG